MKELIAQSKLDFWIANSFNVLLEGTHGVGKTAVVLEAFGRNNVKFKYFSCSTLDPWVDFVGIPKEHTDEQSGIKYLDLVRPKVFAFDEVEIIFLDEMNRAHPKVTNAIMELIQFKSINGHKLNNLKAVWAAINPPAKDEEDLKYHVEELDPAIRSRFHVKHEVPFAIAEGYFCEKYGKEITTRVNKWWRELPKNLKQEFPPREVEYALDMWKAGGDVADSLPSFVRKQTFIKVLTEEITTQPSSDGSATQTGISSSASFILLPYQDLMKMSREKRKSFTAFTKKLSNEEFIQLFLRIAPTVGGTLSTLGSRLLESSTDEQLLAVQQVDVSKLPKTWVQNFIRVMSRIKAERKLI